MTLVFFGKIFVFLKKNGPKKTVFTTLGKPHAPPFHLLYSERGLKSYSNKPIRYLIFLVSYNGLRNKKYLGKKIMKSHLLKPHVSSIHLLWAEPWSSKTNAQIISYPLYHVRFISITWRVNNGDNLT